MISAKHPRIRLQHMLENIDGVVEITADLSVDTIMGSFALKRATERALEIISEAEKALPDDLRETETDIPWKSIISLGNLLRHEYYRIDTGVLAATLKQELPALRVAVLRLLDRVSD